MYEYADLWPERQEHTPLALRPPDRHDGAGHALVKACPPLDLNSCYAYLLLCEHHAKTGVIVEQNDAPVRAVTGYFLPRQPDTLFIWQIAVAPRMRGKKLGEHMLKRCSRSHQLRWIEGTLSPYNHASQKLFARFATESGANLPVTLFFAADDFGSDNGNHDAEHLYKIGPWKPAFDQAILTR